MISIEEYMDRIYDIFVSIKFDYLGIRKFLLRVSVINMIDSKAPSILSPDN